MPDLEAHAGAVSENLLVTLSFLIIIAIIITSRAFRFSASVN